MSKVTDILSGGLAEGKPDSDFNPASVEAGRKEEMEHTDDKEVAREIARDHLTKDKDYYQKSNSFFFPEIDAEKAQPPQPGQQAPEPGQDPMLPMFDPYDMTIQQSVQSQLASVGSMSEKDLFKLSQEVWGDGYEYRPISTHQIRAELRGFLQDQIEWIAQNPMAHMLAEQAAMPTPTMMPHESDPSQSYGPGGNASSALLQEENLDGRLSKQELANGK